MLIKLNVRRVVALSALAGPDFGGLYAVNVPGLDPAASRRAVVAVAVRLLAERFGAISLQDYHIEVIDAMNRLIGRYQRQVADGRYAALQGVVEVLRATPIYVPGSDYAISSAALKARYSPDGVGEHPKYLPLQWSEYMKDHGSKLDYWSWVVLKLEEEEEASKRSVSSSGIAICPTATFMMSIPAI